ncbi:DUF6121 family protein [Leifsonia sp. AG29]|uniref:DUF6121 family protein n=1 Tax=Leifsonia sp. AG29 TaxID=2598860 RepID=UPI00131ECDF3|nr:DUF6121 family protein [Leifsonia sp. AG29]
MREERKYATIVACFAAGLYLALIVAAFGILSLLTETDPVSDSTVGPLVGPFMVGGAVLTLLIFLIALGTRVPADKQRVSPGAALATGIACYLVYIAAGGITGAAGDPQNPFHYFLFAVSQLGSWYAITAGILAALVVLLYQLVLVGRFRQRGRPRWPWERDEDE